MWNVQASFLAPPNPLAISCASASAPGRRKRFDHHEQRRRDVVDNQPVPNGVAVLFGVSCASPSYCLAVGYGDTAGMVISTTDGGASWTILTVPSVETYSGVSCVSALRCVAVGSNGGNMFGQGRTPWLSPRPTAAPLGRI